MSMIAAALRELLALGVEGEALVSAIERIEAARDEPKATGGAARQRRYRERKASRVTSQASQSVTVTPRYAPSPKEALTPSSETTSLDQNPIPPPLRPPALVASSRLKSRRCPADYTPSQAVLETAKREGFIPGEIERELARFKDHQFRDAHSDWDAAFRNWLRTAADRTHRNGHDRPAAKQSAREANYARAFAGAEDAARRRAER